MINPISSALLVTENQRHERELRELHEGWRLREKELLAQIERLEAQLAEAKNLYIDERTEGLFDQEQLEEADDAEKYFDRMMELTAKQTLAAEERKVSSEVDNECCRTPPRSF